MASVLAKAKVVLALSVSDGSLDASLAGVGVDSGHNWGVGLSGRGRVGAKRWLGLAGRDVQSDGQGRQAGTVKRIGETSCHGANVSVVVVQTTSTDIGDVHERCVGQDGGAAALQSKGLLSNSSIDLDQSGAGTDVLGDRVASGCDSHSAGRLEKTDNVDNIFHGVPSVRTAHEVVLIGVGRGVVGCRISGVAVESLQVASVPVDELVLLDVLGNVGILSLVGGDVGLGEVEPAVVRHVIGPLGRAVVGVLGLERANVVGLAIVVPGKDLDHGEALLQDFVPAVEDEGATRENPVLFIKSATSVDGVEMGLGYLGPINLGSEVREEPGRNS